MQGYVLAFRPATGRGTIVAENGATYSFNDGCAAADLQGGDLVSFEASRTGGSSGPAQNIRLVERWSQRLTAREKPLVHRFLSDLRGPAAPR